MNFTQQYGKNRQRCQKKFTMLYGNYCYIFIENFPQKFSSCGETVTQAREQCVGLSVVRSHYRKCSELKICGSIPPAG